MQWYALRFPCMTLPYYAARYCLLMPGRENNALQKHCTIGKIDAGCSFPQIVFSMTGNGHGAVWRTLISSWWTDLYTTCDS
ncbi:hypothetical protein VTK26DRAFT_8723 [Humicola hyalothermophila]